MNKQALRRLAIAVKNRRAELGLAQGDLAARGGPSVVVVGQIEREQQANPQTLTLARLDRALEWETGSSASILAGGAPTPVTRSDVRWLRPATDENPVIAAIIADPYLLPAAKQHFLNQYELLLQIRPREDERLPYVAHGKRPSVDPAEEKRIEDVARAAREANPDAPGTV